MSFTILLSLPRLSRQTGHQRIHYKISSFMKIPPTVLHKKRPYILKKTGIIEFFSEILFELCTGNPMPFVLHVL